MYRFMHNQGTVKKDVQEVILETCKRKAQYTDDLKIVFRELYNYYKKREK